jgi:DNA-directed RNA polymerases I and III subunit RPAC2
MSAPSSNPDANQDGKDDFASRLFEIQEGQDEFSRTFIFSNEDHTFGNALRYILMQKSCTEFCGYSVPHPYDPKLNLRLQTTGKPAVDVLLEGLEEMALCGNILEETFDKALKKFHRK